MSYVRYCVVIYKKKDPDWMLVVTPWLKTHHADTHRRLVPTIRWCTISI